MKITKKILVGIIVVAALFTMASCNFDFGTALQDAIDNAVWPYSENGETEINTNFAALLGDDYIGVYGWTVTINDNGVTDTFDLTYYSDKSGETEKQKFVYEKGTTKLVRLVLGEDTYYIDETNKTVTSTNNSTFTPMVMPTFYGLKYGIIELLDDEEVPQWTFVSKTEDVSITNSAGANESVIEYVYNSVEATDSVASTKMVIDFQKVITPMLARIYYEVYSNSVLDKTITVYNKLHTGEEVTVADFAIPTVAEGYTVE